MTIDRAGFLRRWSERKLAAKAEPQTRDPVEATDQPSPDEPVEPFDPASLPTIESLTADSDYTAFLRPGVPSALTNAALRQAWLSDPLISTFKEMADYDWDFNAPGYGALLPTDDVQALLSRVINRPEPEPEPETPVAKAEALESDSEDKIIVAPPLVGEALERAPDPEFVASQHDKNHEDLPEELYSDAPPLVLRRPRHGGALPS